VIREKGLDLVVVEPLDVAPTLSVIMITKPPSGSRRIPLQEVMQIV